jgi:hypothetical protein
MLKKAKCKGITVADFPKGYRLAARIGDLRDLDHDIITVRSGRGGLARYILIKESRRVV